MQRILRALEQWLPLLSCLSGAIVPVRHVTQNRLTADAEASSDLDAQMYELLDFVIAQERMWRPERRV